MDRHSFDGWPSLLTTEQLVRLLQLPSVSTLYEWNKKGTGPRAYRVGRYLRYRKDEVLKWLDGRDGSLD
jgi:predicted DNA-binding transcriptional regulator AlpA